MKDKKKEKKPFEELSKKMNYVQSAKSLGYTRDQAEYEWYVLKVKGIV
jgi:hypothetical protein